MTWKVTAEHTQGKSVSHPCTTGIYEDPANVLALEIEAGSAEAADRAGEEALRRLVEAAEPCACSRRLLPGSESWWESVVIFAMAAGDN